MNAFFDRAARRQVVHFALVHAQSQAIVSKTQLHLLQVYSPLASADIEPPGSSEANER
jgi:hypothetical protein